MKIIKKITVILFVFFIALIIFELIRTIANPLGITEDKIREQLLEKIPVGTTMNEVIDIVQNNEKWSDFHIDHEFGYDKNHVLGEMIGKKHISVYIGEYRSIKNYYFITSVKVYFGFNEQSKLIDIRVQKMTDSL